MRRFLADSDPDERALEKLAGFNPRNPFQTIEYARARQRGGEAVCSFCWAEDDQIVSGCLGFLRRGRFTKSLEIPSLSCSDDLEGFCLGILDFCRRQRVWDLYLGSYGSAPFRLPPLPTHVRNQRRQEYILDLTSAEPFRPRSENHRRNIKKAERAGFRLQRSRSADARRSHAALMAQSLRRRSERGEAIPEAMNDADIRHLLDSGCGELFQARLPSGEVYSSILILRSAHGAYYQSAGSHPEGMKIGASVFLVARTIGILRGEGVLEFNLGGAGEDARGLQRFKAGFGARIRELEAAEVTTANVVLRRARTAARLLLRDPKSLIEAVVSCGAFAVYAGNPHTIPPAENHSEFQFEKLSDSQVARWATDEPEFREQGERVINLGFNSAYGLSLNGEPAHVSWLVPAEDDAGSQVRNVKLRAGEAEITHCVTAGRFRGQGLYPHAIRLLCGLAREMNIQKVFMITDRRNRVSRRGIEKAGLKPAGYILTLGSPVLSRTVAIRLRLHRWPLVRRFF